MGNRKHERKPVSAPVWLVFNIPHSDRQFLSGELTDISEGGAGLHIEPRAQDIPIWLAERGLQGELTILHAGSSDCQTFRVETVWFREDFKSRLPTVCAGLRFAEDPEQRTRVCQLIERLPQRWKPVFA